MYSIFVYLLVNLFLLKLTFSASAFHSPVKFPSCVKKHPSVGHLTRAITEGSKIPILLDGKSFKEEVVEQITSSLKKKFIAVKYDSFIKSVPHLKSSGAVIYVPDFLVLHGRLFNEYETVFMKTLSGNSNLIILGSENLESIPFKDNEMNKYFHLIKMPDIRRKHLVLHVKNMIAQNGYDEYLATLPWEDAPLETLSFEMINMMIFELAMLRAEYSASFTLETIISNVNELKEFREMLKC